ncbi:MAG: hypothetical protein Q9224_000758 [Gallowayella concinna]
MKTSRQRLALSVFCLARLPSDHLSQVLTHPSITDIITPLRCICSAGEFQLEAYWTERILNCASPREAKLMLQNFTYHDNYMDLIRMELNALDSVTRGARPRKFAVLGSGPLPMTSLCISQSLNSDEDAVVVHNVDRDAWAISKSTALCRRLGYRPEQVGFHCADVEVQAFDLRGFDVVYLAGLVGTTNEQKQNIIAGIVEQMSPGRPQRQSNFGGPEAIVDRPPMQPYHQLRGNLPDRTDETRSLHTAGVDEETNPRLTSRGSQACGLVNRIQTSAQPLMHLAGNSSSGYYVFVE